MSLTRDRKNIVFECDHCHDTLETETREFPEALEKLREEEWAARKFANDFYHFCTAYCLTEWLAKRKKEQENRIALRRV